MTCETLELEGNVLVILNTKDAVKELYHEIKRTIDSKDYKDVEIVVLTTNLYANDRKRKIAQIREYLKNKKIIVISTQLIEAGVDISFKVVIRSLAGLDSIIQASGRCNRHAEMGESYGRVYLVNPEFENLDKLPDIKQGKDIMQSLLIMYRSNPIEFGGDITNQKVIRKYFERYNEHQRGKMLYPFKTRTGVNHNIYDLLADNSQNACSVKNTIGIEYIQEMRQSYKLAGEYFRPIEEHGTPVVVSHAESTELISEVLSNTNYENKTIYLRKLQLYTVNISISLFKELGDAISYKEDLGIYILKEGYYNETLGVTSQKQDTVFYFY